MPSNSNDITQLSLATPLQGEFVLLQDIPDPAFAQKMVGDGAAIDPVEGKLYAPCDGQVTMIHPSKHAVSIASPCGNEILMHIGVDTVKLRGEGFELHVAEGDKINKGDLLIEFDLDKVAQSAASMITPILITDQEKVSTIVRDAADSISVGDAFLTFSFGEDQVQDDTLEQSQRSSSIKIANGSGIHARPAAQLVKIAKQYAGNIQVVCGQRSANAKSVVSIMGLNIAFGDEVFFESNGADYQDAFAALLDAIEQGLGEETAEVETASDENLQQALASEPSLLFPQSTNESLLNGVTAAPGYAQNKLFKLEEVSFDYSETSNDASSEQALLVNAIQASSSALISQIDTVEDKESDSAQILKAHIELLEDPALQDDANASITSGMSAPAAWQHAISQQVHVLEGLANPLMQQRATDLKDVGGRVMRQLLNMPENDLEQIPQGAVLAARELTPSQISNLSIESVSAIITTTGSASSHVAIISRSLNIPMVAAVSEDIMSHADGTDLLVDAHKGVIHINPSQQEIDELAQQKAQQEALKQAAKASADEAAVTLDGKHIEVAANIGTVTDAHEAAEQGAEGIGLLRSEFLFLERLTPPSEDEQQQAYQGVIEGIGINNPVIIRTLDVGGDKPLPYISIPHEENPFLGERGIRIGLDRPQLLRIQFRALIRAAQVKTDDSAKLRIMLPMIGNVSELKLARKVLEEECKTLAEAGLAKPTIAENNIELGVMIEVPSAALMADLLAEEADFFSIGTNDLTQYTLAIDRGNARLAPLADNLDPAVLRMIDLTVKGASKHNRWVGVCGGMAAQELAQPILLGLGVDELSVNAGAVAETKYAIRHFNHQACRNLAEQALMCTTAQQVKDLVIKYIADAQSEQNR